MGNDLVRVVATSIQKPWEDCCKYCADSIYLTCKSACCGNPCECAYQTHAFQDDPESALGRPCPGALAEDVPV